jgi:hypothetical protein
MLSANGDTKACWNVDPAQVGHVEAASRCLADAFAADPLISFFFRTNPRGVHHAALEFFSLLLRVRIALELPALVLADGATMLGAAMGNNTEPPEWPGHFGREWAMIDEGDLDGSPLWCLFRPD